MTLGSLRWRLLAAWAIVIAITLVLSGYSLRTLYERGITRSTLSDLTFDIKELKDRLRISKTGEVDLRSFPTDPQFHFPNGGRYWQIFSGARPVLSSFSLRRNVFHLVNNPEPDDGLVEMELEGPMNQNILALARAVRVKVDDNKIQSFVIVAGLDKREIQEDTDEFTDDIIQGSIGIALLFMFAGWVQVTIGLAPLLKLKSVLAEVRAGHKSRIDEKFPVEVLPLIRETNLLLDEQDAALEAARLRAGNLAHGFITPLAILATESRSLHTSGAPGSAKRIDEQIENLRLHVELELALYKARGISSVRPNRLNACEELRTICHALQKLPESQNLSWQLALPVTAYVDVDRIDFNNIMGNLLDNARKWAVANLAVSIKQLTSSLKIVVEDDGPGLPKDQVDRLLKPGERAAPNVAGTGLGLAIVKDLVEVYGGSLGFATSGLGGAMVWVELPVGQQAKRQLKQVKGIIL